MPKVMYSEKPIREVDLTPLHERACGNWIESYLEYHKGQEATPKMHRWTAISVIAGALERKVWFDCGAFVLFPNLYVFIVGKSGIVRKSTCIKAGLNFLSELEDIGLVADMTTKAALIEQFQQTGKTFHLNGNDVFQSPAFIYSSEVSVFLRENFGAVHDLLTDWYDCADSWSYTTKKDGKTELVGTCLNMLAATTPEWLLDAVPAEHLYGGFGSRINFVVENSVPAPVAWPELPDDNGELKRNLSADLKLIHSLAGQYTITPEAKAYAEDYYTNQIHQQKLGNTDHRFNGYYGRKFATALKLSMVAAAAESNSLEVQTKHFTQAITWLDELEQSMMHAFGVAGGNPLARGMKQVKDLIIGNGGHATERQLHAIVWQGMSRSVLSEVLSELVSLGHLTRKISGDSARFYLVEDSPEI